MLESGFLKSLAPLRCPVCLQITLNSVLNVGSMERQRLLPKKVCSWVNLCPPFVYRPSPQQGARNLFLFPLGLLSVHSACLDWPSGARFPSLLSSFFHSPPSPSVMCSCCPAPDPGSQPAGSIQSPFKGGGCHAEGWGCLERFLILTAPLQCVFLLTE